MPVSGQAACPAHSVDVGVQVGGKVVVDDKGQVLDVQAPGSHISRDQNLSLAGFPAGHGLLQRQQTAWTRFRQELLSRKEQSGHNSCSALHSLQVTMQSNVCSCLPFGICHRVTTCSIPRCHRISYHHIHRFWDSTDKSTNSHWTTAYSTQTCVRGKQYRNTTTPPIAGVSQGHAANLRQVASHAGDDGSTALVATLSQQYHRCRARIYRYALTSVERLLGSLVHDQASGQINVKRCGLLFSFLFSDRLLGSLLHYKTSCYCSAKRCSQM